MSEVKVEHFYGIYPSSVYGNLLLVDPLLPPRKCYVDCITCPLRRDRVTEASLTASQPSQILGNIEERLPTGVELNGVLLWGSGDPLQLVNIHEILLSLRAFLSSRGIGRKLYVHTSLLGLLKCSEGSAQERARFVLEQVDVLLIPFLWYGAEKYLLGWPRERSFSEYLELLRKTFESNRDKLIIELHLFKVHENYYPEHFHIDETVAVLRYIKAEALVLKPVDRPPASPHVKPLPESRVKRVCEFFVEEGFKVNIDRYEPPSTPPRWQKTATVLYNHLLRIPSKYVEIKAMYGDLGIIALNNLLSKNMVSRIPWSGDIYFTGK
ncbi:MAG: hypothetical protein QXH02_02800 [Desulfurococcaceae archaeon]